MLFCLAYIMALFCSLVGWNEMVTTYKLSPRRKSITLLIVMLCPFIFAPLLLLITLFSWIEFILEEAISIPYQIIFNDELNMQKQICVKVYNAYLELWTGSQE